MSTDIPPLPPLASPPQYGGFWLRFGAYWLDAIVLAPTTALFTWISGFDRDAYLFTVLPSFALSIFVHVYCVQRWGGSPGKLICGLRIVKLSLEPAGRREAWLRYAPMLALGVASMAVFVHASNQISKEEFLTLSFMERSVRIMEAGGTAQTVLNWATQVWVWSEFIVLLTNKRRRSIHDFIAGTVVVKKPNGSR